VGQLVPFNRSQVPARFSRALERQLTHEQERIEAIAEIAQGAMDSVSTVHAYATMRALTTLQTNQLMQAAANGTATDEVKAALAQMDQAYLRHVTAITQSASARIVLSARDAQLEPGSGGVLESIVDGLTRWF
jgi:hypothetical protein